MLADKAEIRLNPGTPSCKAEDVPYFLLNTVRWSCYRWGMRICGREFNDEVIGRIEATIKAEPEISRRELSRRVCRWLDWKAPHGNLRDMIAASPC